MKIVNIKIIIDQFREAYYFFKDIFVPDMGSMSRKLEEILTHSEDRKIYLNATREMREKGLKRKTIILSNGKMTIEL